ncbi:oxidoreductase, aldo/keto reductase family [Syntrophotalea carbinolica DSM 2380]|uniref:Oxidoreductase, aldo/keto reductase family n=1 Tax=Syntrophotalea carbinolica (strain DSM 2380 / NBRC 103641 / GraBd1) TaxID=338963 RepID=Q3A5H0_SYNC1|nr:aldo/keto reductase [Syntrophotalea carbinolica]ABA88387.1 oxidoreductase, aldo/keto reductase family [Syntrophotalea carbinolica DSM 2380]
MVGAMEYRDIPRAGFRVSRLTLGTVEFGMEYGIGKPGSSLRPTAAEAETVIQTAIDHGINLFDTAPAYGESEIFLGTILAGIGHGELRIATKVGPFGDAAISTDAVRQSLERSLCNLQRDRLDLVQIHNATAAQLYHSPLMETLVRARERGDIGAIGASVYGEEAALASLRHPDIATLQIAYNLLDRRMADKVLPSAKERGIAVMGRSVFLKGALTPRRRYLPEHLNKLKNFAEKAAAWAEGHALTLPEAALRFCLANDTLNSVLIGVSSLQELHTALSIAGRGPLPARQRAEACGLAIADEKLIDPRFWGIDS